MKITSDFPGGNIRVISANGFDIVIDNELRDTSRDWFYWCFKAVFPAAGTYHFHFDSPWRVGSRGPAYSLDNGQTWKWLCDSCGPQDFSYVCSTPGLEVLFCQGMQYLERDFRRLCNEFPQQIRVSTLCRSRKGRPVEIAEIGAEAPKFIILATARHHAGEMMANHVLEGMVRAALADTMDGQAFRQNAALAFVPFVDKDGVEDGDQGKGREPRDHARDYDGVSIYPETQAIREWMDARRPDVVLDIHCPWLREGNHETAYLVGSPNPRMASEMDRFAIFLEEESPAEAPYFKKDNLLFGMDFNVPSNYTEGCTVTQYAANNLPFVTFAQSMEIPFANFGAVTVDRFSALLFGAAVFRALMRYLNII